MPRKTPAVVGWQLAGVAMTLPMSCPAPGVTLTDVSPEHRSTWPPPRRRAQPRLRRWTDGFDPADDIDRIIMSVRRSVFPWHGLEPLPHWRVPAWQSTPSFPRRGGRL